MDNLINRIEVVYSSDQTECDIDFFFIGDPNPYSNTEFIKGTPTRELLDTLINLICVGPITRA